MPSTSPYCDTWGSGNFSRQSAGTTFFCGNSEAAQTCANKVDTEASDGFACACLAAACEQQPPTKAEPTCAAACFTWAWIEDELACDNDDDAIDNCVYYAMLWCTNGQKGTWSKQPPGGCGGAAHTFTTCENACGDKWMRNADESDNDGASYGACMQDCETS
jgi:hypothetical protein